MGAIYELIGRAVVRLAWWRFGTQIKVAGAVVVAGALAAGYVLSHREPPEG
jgi:hypothetical protein